MCNCKHIALPKRFWRLFVRCEQLGKEVFALNLLAAERVPLVYLFQRHTCDQEVAGAQRRHIFPQGIASEDKVPLRDLANDTVVPLHVVNRFDGFFQILSSFEKSKLAGKGNLPKNVESVVVQCVAQIAVLVTSLAHAIQLRQEQTFGVLDVMGHGVHRSHGIWVRGIPLLHRMNLLSGLRENIRILWRGEDAIEVCLVEAFPGCEHFFGRIGRCEAEFIRCNSHDGTITSVYIDVIQLGVPGPCAPDFKGISDNDANINFRKESRLPFQARLPEARRGPGYFRRGDAYL